MIRKRVDGKGYVLILDNIIVMRVDIENGVVLLKIKSEN